MKRNPKPLARFRVYGWKTSLYFIVQVWRTKREMLDNRVALGLPRLRDCTAHVFSYDRIQVSGKHRRKLPSVGEINFHRKGLGTEVVTHESFHATASLLRRLGFDFGGINKELGAQTFSYGLDPEEIVADVQGKLARAIVSRLYDKGLIS